MTMPTNLLGQMDSLDINGYGAVVDLLLEQIVQLTHPDSVRTYARMRHDPMAAAILQAYGGPIGRAYWAVDGAGCRDEVTQRVADALGLPIAGYDEGDPDAPENKGKKVLPPTGARRRKFTWAEHLRIAGLYRVFGHMFFEQAWAPMASGWQLDVVQERMPQTVAAIHLNRDGTLKSIEQNVAHGPAPKITTADCRLIAYVRNREGSNYFGESMLRPCYGPWLIKDQMLRVHATSIRKFGMGVPTLEQIPGTPTPQPQQIAEAQRVLSRIRASEGAGTVVPAPFRLALTGMTGSVPDALGFINFLNQEMARSTLTMLLVMVAAEKGNRSLGETVMDLMIMAQQADAEAIASTGTRDIVIPLVDGNWGEDEPAPRIAVGNVGADVETTAQDIYWLMAYGGLKPDAPARSWIRQLRGMPPEDPNDPVFAQPAPDPGAPPIPGGAA